MEERELTRLLQELGDRTTPSPPPLRRIVDAGEALSGRRRSARVRVFAVSAAAAALVGGGAVAATVVDLPTGGNDSASSAGEAAADGAGGGADSGAGSAEEGAAAPLSFVGVTPAVADPGTVVRLAVPADVAFGPEWTLERAVDGSWRPVSVLVDADFARDNGVVLSRPFNSSSSAADQATRTRRDPVPVVIPEATVAGTYRICQPGGDGGEWCGEVTVTR